MSSQLPITPERILGRSDADQGNKKVSVLDSIDKKETNI